MAPRRVAPGPNPPRQVPSQQERSCQEVPRSQEAARALPAPARRDPPPAPARQDPALLLAAAQGDPQGQALPQPKSPAATAGCPPTPPSCVASRGPASSGRTCLLATTAQLIPRSSS